MSDGQFVKGAAGVRTDRTVRSPAFPDLLELPSVSSLTARVDEKTSFSSFFGGIAKMFKINAALKVRHRESYFRNNVRYGALRVARSLRVCCE